jgi:hypothetical protein
LKYARDVATAVASAAAHVCESQHWLLKVALVVAPAFIQEMAVQFGSSLHIPMQSATVVIAAAEGIPLVKSVNSPSQSFPSATSKIGQPGHPRRIFVAAAPLFC